MRRIEFRCTDSEKTAWQARADELGVTLSEFVRLCANGALVADADGDARPVPEPLPENRSTVRDLPILDEKPRAEPVRLDPVKTVTKRNFRCKHGWPPHQACPICD